MTVTRSEFQKEIEVVWFHVTKLGTYRWIVHTILFDRHHRHHYLGVAGCHPYEILICMGPFAIFSIKNYLEFTKCITETILAMT